MQGQSGGQSKGQGGMAVPPGGRDPLNEENGTLPMDGSREVEDSAGLFLEGDLKKARSEEDAFSDKDLHQQAIAAAKSRFTVYPSAYAGAYISQKYKDLYKRKHGSLEGAFKGKKEKITMPKKDAAEAMKVSGLLLNDYDEAALVNQSDIDAALNDWKAEAPERFKDILEATNVEP